MFTSKVNGAMPWDRSDFVALVLALLTTGWVFALKLKTFYDLGYSGDLFDSVQIARSWLEGKGVRQDNCFGNVLAIHTYFMFLPLGFIAKPFGAPGLLFVLAASMGVTYFWAARILRLLGVAESAALVAAAVMLASPLSVAFYQEGWLWISSRADCPAIMFNPVLFPASRTADSINPDGARDYQRERGRANCRGRGGDSSWD